MQVMPFWPTELGLSRKDLIDVLSWDAQLTRSPAAEGI
jgi:hypothetical protein